MHTITFACKRAHLQAVAFGVKAVRRIKDMTPAGFDLLYAIRMTAGYHARWDAPEISQAELVRTLGLHRSTVSKMIKRLKRLGWVTNGDVDPEDRRTRLVR